MEDKEYGIDEIIDTRKGVNQKRKNKRKKVNKKLLIIIGCSLISILVLTLSIYLIINNKKEDTNNLVYEDFDPLISKYDDDRYYIFGAKNNISFEIEKKDGFSYKVLDENEEDVSVNSAINGNTITIKAPNNLYQEGKTYKLKVINGTFKDEKLRDANEVVFSIARPASQTSKIKDNVIKVDNKDIEIKDNTLTTKNKYKENDIIVLLNNDSLKEAYKITKVNSNNTYEIIIPQIKDIFDELDYYGMEKVNLSAFVTNDDLKSYLIASVRKAILDSLVDTVYAKSNVEIKNPIWDKKTNKLKFSVSIDTDESNKVFGDDFLKNHKSIIELEIEVSANLYKDVSLDKYNYALSLEFTFNPNISLTNTNDNLNTLASNIKNGKKDYDASWLLTDYDKINKDSKRINKSLGNITIPTEIPGLYVLFDMGIMLDINNKSLLDSSLNGSIKATAGINSKNDSYGDFTFDSKSNITFTGDGENKIGYSTLFGLDFMGVVYLKSIANYGLYIDGKSTISSNEDKDKNKIITYEVKADSGFFGEYIINSKDIYNEKKSLSSYEKKIDFSKKEEKKDNTVEEKKTYKYTADEIRKKLQESYDTLDKLEEWTKRGGTSTVDFNGKKTIDVNSNLLIDTWNYDYNSVSYTCSYNYVIDSMTCNGFAETQNHIKELCDDFYNEYVTYLETGEADNEDAIEWETLYGNLDNCYYETIPKNEPTDYKDSIDKILEKAGITKEDLEVLKN